MPLRIKFKIIGPISDRRTIAVGNRIRELERLKQTYGHGRWRKMSGSSPIELTNGEVVLAEVHWYEGVRREAVRQFTGKPSNGRELNH